MRTAPRTDENDVAPQEASSLDYVDQLLASEFGAPIVWGIVCDPQQLNRLQLRTYYVAYRDFNSELREHLKLIQGCSQGRDLCISANAGRSNIIDDASAARSRMSDSGAFEGNDDGGDIISKIVSPITNAFWKPHVDEAGVAAATRHLPPALQQLGGIVLRPQGDTQRGYVIPTVVLHYAAGMAQMTEMYCEDMAAGDLDEWVCRPGDWGVSGAVGEALRKEAIRTSSGGGVAMLAIDTTTTRYETLELIAAFCVALSVKHIDLDARGVLDTDSLPVFPTTSTVASQPSTHTPAPISQPQMQHHKQRVPMKLPVSIKLPQPFPSLSASVLLPAGYPDYKYPIIPVDVVENYRRLCTLLSQAGAPYLDIRSVPPETRGLNMAMLRNHTQTGIATLREIVKGISLLTPLESAFALEYLLPSGLHGRRTTSQQHDKKRGEGESTWTEKDEGRNLKSLPIGTTLQRLQSNLPKLSDSEFVYLTALGGLLLDPCLLCGTQDDAVCGGRQVDPRLGFIPYAPALKYPLVLGFPLERGPALRCTLDLFLLNAEQKAQDVLNLERHVMISNTINGHSKAVLFAGHVAVIYGASNEDILAIQDLDDSDETKQVNTGEERPRGPAPSLPKLKQSDNNKSWCSKEEELMLLHDSLTRTADVMKVANFLGLTSLVNLCGLVTAMLIQGKSLVEVRKMFSLKKSI